MSKIKNTCTKYTQKRGNYCTIECCNKIKKLILDNANDIMYCPVCGNKLLEIGYACINVFKTGN